MKTILLFPGIDAIESNHLRTMAIQWPEVQIRIEEAQTILDKLKVKIKLNEVMHSKRQENLEWFTAMILASMAVQVGVFDHYRKQDRAIDLLLGMSLGDLARSVCGGVSSFTASFIGLLQFMQKVSEVEGCGSTYQVKLKKSPEDIESILQCKKFEVAISVYQSDISFLISGSIENLNRWYAYISTLENVNAQELFKIPVPLHHELLKDVAKSITPHIQKHAHFEKRNYPIFSSILEKELESSEELKEGLVKNIYSPVKFAPAIHQIMKRGEPVTFVNIGPASTLFAFIKQMNIPRSQYQLINYFSEESKKINRIENIKTRL